MTLPGRARWGECILGSVATGSPRLAPAAALAAALALLALPACEREEGEEEKEGVTPEAQVVMEGGLPVLVLSEEQEKSLGVRLEPVEPRPLARRLELTGWVEARPGAAGEARAPLAGFLLSAESWPAPGLKVKRDRPLCLLRPVLAPAERLQAAALLGELAKEEAEAARDLTRAQALLQAAASQLQRARGLLAESAGSKKALEEAVLQEAGAAAELKAAEEKRHVFEEKRVRIAQGFERAAGSNGGGPQPGSAPAPLEVHSPLAGEVLAVRAAPGEFVEAGRVLFEVADLDPVWVRVPVFEGDLAAIDPEAPLELELPGAKGPPATARPAARAPAVDPARRAADLFFELKDPERRLLLGQSLRVRVKTSESGAALLVPASAVAFDPRGAAWVYLARGSRRYARRRVETGAWLEGRVEVRRGLAAGDQVVAAGAAELLGSELGTGGE